MFRQHSLSVIILPKGTPIPRLNSVLNNTFATITLPQSLFELLELPDKPEIGIFFSFYTMSTLFPLVDSSSNRTVTSVIGTSVAGMTVANLTDPVTVMLHFNEVIRA